MPELRLNLGSGNDLLPGYINIDKYDKQADVQMDIDELDYKTDSCDEVVAFQVLEHLPYQETEKVFREIYRVLKPGGKAILETPDLEVIARQILDKGVDYNVLINLYGEYYRPWDKDRYPDWQRTAPAIHINGFDYKRMEELASKVGFSECRRRKLEEIHPKYRYDETLSVELIK